MHEFSRILVNVFIRVSLRAVQSDDDVFVSYVDFHVV